MCTCWCVHMCVWKHVLENLSVYGCQRTVDVHRMLSCVLGMGFEGRAVGLSEAPVLAPGWHQGWVYLT